MTTTYTLIAITPAGHRIKRGLAREGATLAVRVLNAQFPNVTITLIRDSDGAAVPLPPLLPVTSWKNEPQYAAA